LRSKSVFLKGPVIGLPDEIPFRSDREYIFCRICGELFQPELERLPDDLYTLEVMRQSMILQKLWADGHNKTHPDWEHRQFVLSGRFLSPEATYKLVPFGVIPLSDLVFDGDSAKAGLEAPRMSDFRNYEW
jgi:hypothetical protein